MDIILQSFITEVNSDNFIILCVFELVPMKWSLSASMVLLCIKGLDVFHCLSKERPYLAMALFQKKTFQNARILLKMH